MKVQFEFQKALLLLDRGELDRGREGLERVVARAELEGDIATLLPSLVCLGDLLVQSGSSREAEEVLTKALSFGSEREHWGYELDRAQQLLWMNRRE